jgi:hypothetical protein
LDGPYLIEGDEQVAKGTFLIVGFEEYPVLVNTVEFHETIGIHQPAVSVAK